MVGMLPETKAVAKAEVPAMIRVADQLNERLATLGIAVNMVTLLTTTMYVRDAVTNFLGTSFMLGLLGGFVAETNFFADSFLGRYLPIAIFTAAQASVLVHNQVRRDDSGGNNFLALEVHDEGNLNPVPVTPAVSLSGIQRIKRAVFAHVMPTDQIDEQQERYRKYSLKALGFALCLFVASLASASSSGSTGSMAFISSMAAFFGAFCTDLYSYFKKPKWARALVYFSSFHLSLMTFLAFILFDKVYSYAVLALLPTVGGAAVQHILRSRVWQRHMNDDEASQDLDRIFELSSFILNCGGFFTWVFPIISHFVPYAIDNTAVCRVIGFFSVFTIVLSNYLMAVTTVRIVALTRHAKYLVVLLCFLVVGTLMASAITTMDRINKLYIGLNI